MRGLLASSLVLFVASAAVRESIIADMPDVDDEGEAYDSEPYDEDYMAQMAQMGGGIEMMGGQYYYDDGGMTEEVIGSLFLQLDRDQDGHLSREELRQALKDQAEEYQRGAQENSKQEARAVLSTADSDGDSQLSLQEFQSAETLYLHHDGALEREALFRFADGRADREADGQIDVVELQLLVFPEFSSRAGQFRQFLRDVALGQHDADGDGLLDKRELFGFHAKSIGLGEVTLDEGDAKGGDGGDGDGGHARPSRSVGGGAAFHWSGGGSLGDEEDAYDAQDYFGHRLDRQAEYASHNHTFDWHDKDGDGLLDRDELGDYLLPATHLVHEGYVEEELERILGSLRQFSEEQAADRFSLDHVMSIGREFIGTFEALVPTMDPDMGERVEL